VPPLNVSPLTWVHWLVLFICIGTIVLWGLNGQIGSFTGNIGITALIPPIMYYSAAPASVSVL
jgi:hypothetical protein